MLLKRGGGEGAGRIQASRTWRVGPIQDTFAGCRVLPSHSSRDARVLFTSHSSTLMGTRNTVVCCYVSAFCNAIASRTQHMTHLTNNIVIRSNNNRCHKCFLSELAWAENNTNQRSSPLLLLLFPTSTSSSFKFYVFFNFFTTK